MGLLPFEESLDITFFGLYKAKKVDWPPPTDCQPVLNRELSVLVRAESCQVTYQPEKHLRELSAQLRALVPDMDTMEI